MSFEYSGKCICGSVAIKFTLPKSINSLVPRACDCDFCRTRNIAYLSHPEGKIVIQSTLQLDPLKQGSNQAEFLTCKTCQQVIAVSFNSTKAYVGALNSKVLDVYSALAAPEIVSPQKLNANEKIQRWTSLWSVITII
jgi:hypothetical protein